MGKAQGPPRVSKGSQLQRALWLSLELKGAMLVSISRSKSPQVMNCPFPWHLPLCMDLPWGP